MINRFLTDIKVIKNAINTKKLVVFAGSGISVDSGVPSWGKLIEEIKKELDLPENENDYLKIPQIYYNERQEKEYVEKIRSILGHKKLKYNEIHEEIFELNPEHILTTNFEDLLEQVLNKKSLPFSVVKQDVDLPYSDNTKLLVKVHGDLDNSDFVLKEDDYLNYSKSHPLIEAFINSVFASKVVLFIGYSFSDYNLKQIVQNVRNILGNNFQNAYLLSVDKNIHLSHKQYLKNKGINIIDYFDAVIEEKPQDRRNYIEDFLQGKNIYNESYFKSYESLSEKGQLLLNLIKFIRHYDDLKIKITKENVVNQLYNSLIRFSELKSLPQDFISKLYPFKTKLEYEHLVEKTSLLLKDLEVKNLFFENIKIENDKLTFTSEKNLSPDEIQEKQIKLTEVVKKLNNSLILYVSEERKKADSTGFKGLAQKGKNIQLTNDKKCKCSKCKFERNELDEVLKDLNSYSINEISEIKKDTQIAYLNYKFGNYLQSFNMFEEIASKSWQMGKYITYYIAKNNMKSLKGLIRFNEERIEDKEKNKLVRKIEDIDSDKLIFQVPYKSIEEYELLKIIRDDSILINASNEIEELYKNIEEIFIGYKTEYFNYHGPYYPQLVYIELYKILQFYTQNYIINDVYSLFRKTIQKGIECLILSHITSNTYDGKLEKLSSDFFKMAISYCNSKTLLDFLNKNEVEDLEFEQDEIEDILEYCENYFKSLYNTSELFSNNFKNEVFFNHLGKESFKVNMRSIFNNMMLLLLSIKIPKERESSFVLKLLSFLEYENFIHDGIKYLNEFIEKNHQIFSKKDCERLLKLTHNQLKKYERHNSIDSIANVMNQNKYELFDDKDYILKVLSDYDYSNPNNSIIVSLWKLSNEEIKDDLLSLLIKKLEDNFNENLYVKASFKKVLDYNLFFNEYINLINSNYISLKKDEEIYSLRMDIPSYDNFVFYNAIIFIYNMGVKSNDERLLLLDNLSNSMKFFIFREKSDLSKFKIEWLFLIKRKIVYKELSKIKSLKKIITIELKKKYSQELAQIFSKYFI